MSNWKTTKHRGVRVKESLTKKYKGKPDKYFLIRYGNDGKIIQEGVGWTSEGISAQLASNHRAEILNNIRLGQGHQSLKEKRLIKAATKKAEKTRGVTLKEAFDNFMEVRIDAGKLKSRTQADYRNFMDGAFADWKHIPIINIDGDMIRERHIVP